MIKLKTLLLESNLEFKVQNLRRELKQKYPQIQDLFVHISADKSLYIADIRVKTPGQGIGSKVMADIKAFADAHNLTITLSPQADPRKKEKLRRFYKRHGFIPNKGRHADYSLGGAFGLTLYRRPGINESEDLLPIFRGESVYNKGGRNWTTQKEWARQFTQSGRDREILRAKIDPAVIYRHDPLPHACSQKDFDKIVPLAKELGCLAVWFDEGQNEPPSIYIIDLSVLQRV